MRRMNKNGRDRRVKRSRATVLDAFFTLVLKEPYERITVREIALRAGVSRSTLYEHFGSKDGLLAASLEGPLSMLADTVQAADNTAGIVAVLEHFWANRSIAPGLFAGPMRRHTVGVLVRLIAKRLRSAPPSRRATLVIPVRLAATQLAEVLFAPTAAWTLGQSGCSASRLAAVLRETTQALMQVLHGGGAGR